MKKRIILLSSVSILVIILAAWAKPTQNSTAGIKPIVAAQTAESKNTQAFVNTIYRYSVLYPMDWEVNVFDDRLSGDPKKAAQVTLAPKGFANGLKIAVYPVEKKQSVWLWLKSEKATWIAVGIKKEAPGILMGNNNWTKLIGATVPDVFGYTAIYGISTEKYILVVLKYKDVDLQTETEKIVKSFTFFGG